MTFERIIALAGTAFGRPTRGDFNLELLLAIVPDFCDGCSIELFGRNLPPERAAIWSPFQKILKSAEPVAFGLQPLSDLDPDATGHISPEEGAILRKIGVHSAIGIPLQLDERLAGSFSVYMASSERTFDDADFAGFTEVGRRLEGSITEEWLEGTQPIKLARGEDLSLLARKLSFGRLERYAAERELAERRRQQDAVAELAGRVITEPDLKKVMDEVTRRVREVLEIEYAKVLEYLPNEDTLIVRAVSGFPQDLVDDYRVPTRAGSQAGLTLEVEETLRSPDFESETRFDTPDIPGFDLRSGMSVVIAGAGQPWGVLQADSVTPRDFSDDEAGFMKTVSDIVSQAVERSAAESQLRYRSILLDTIAEAVLGLDLDARVVFWNRQAERMFGWTSDEMAGKIALDALVVPVERERALEVRREVLQGHEASAQLQMFAKDGAVLTVHAAATPVHDARRAMVGWVVTIVDMAERLELESKLRQAQKMEGMGRLAGGVAHDFNNLLTTIAGFTDLQLIEPACTGPMREYAQEIRKATERATNLTAQLLAFSRKQALLPQVFDPRKLIRGVEPLLRRLIGEHIELVLRLDAPVGRILADPNQVEQVIMNLCVNARDAMPLGGTLTVSVNSECPEEPFPVGDAELPPGRYAVISVQDTGSGIPPDVQAQVFDPFFTTKPEGRGTGLGLSTVYGIVQQSGGGVVMDSEPGRGTTFSICLPEIEGTFAEERRSPERLRAESPIGPPLAEGEAGTILVVEDEESVRALLARILPRLGYRVIEAGNGAEALDRFQEQKDEIDLVLTDVIMPVMSGPELASKVEKERPDLPILFISGYTDDMLEGQDIRGRGIPLLQKPFTLDQLSKSLKDTMAGARTSGGET